MDQLLNAFYVVGHPVPLLLVALGVLLGVVVGAVPGLGGAMLIALLLPLTFYMVDLHALILLVAIHCGSVSGGLITSVMLRMPGTPSSVMTTLDGYPLASQGKAGRALSLGIMASTTGGFISWVFLALLSPALADVALQFGPYQMFALILMGLVLIATIAEGAMLKGLLAACFGMAISLIGPDDSSGAIRYDFNVVELQGGLSLLPVLLGVFVISQVIHDLLQKTSPIEQQMLSMRQLVPHVSDLRQHGGNATRSSLIGTWVGILPGVGSAIASIVSYTVAKTLSKHPEKFGRGEEAGLVAAESANNASVNGALIPLITLGIPGSTIDAILIGALVIHGLQPGPLLFQNSPEIAYGIIAGALIANILMAVIMYLLVRPIARISSIDKAYLYPSIIVFCVVGTYAISNNFFDVFVMFVMGAIGFLFRRGGFPIGPLVLGFILAPMAEKELRSGLMLHDGSLWPLFQSPVSFSFILLTILLSLWPLWRRYKACFRYGAR